MKKLLIITYYWPPAGGPGVQRWLKFVKYLPDFDIEPIVYCPENPSYPIIDESLLGEIPDNLKVSKQPIHEPYRFANFLSGSKASKISSGVIPKKKNQSPIQQLMLYVRGNFFIPDARKNWVKPSVAFLSEYISKHDIETVITTGPPHSLHLIGLQLKQNLNLNWLADFRDPWTTIGYHNKLKLTKSSAKKHQDLEREVLNAADRIIVTSNNTKLEFSKKTDTPVEVITNGYDVVNMSKPEKDQQFSLAHIGSLLSERNPRMLWQALNELVTENVDFRQHLQLKLAGVVGQEVLDSINDHGLNPYLKNLGYLSHDDAVRAQKSSQLLLLIEIDSEDTKAIIPGKLFEYMVSGTPILAIGPQHSDVEKIIQKTNTGSYFLYQQKEDIKSKILFLFEEFKSGNLKVNPIGLQKYSRKALTETLANVISEI